MPVLKVKDKVTGGTLEATIDPESVKQISGYNYNVDKYSKKPFREVKEDGILRRYFLDRDILGCRINDGKMVYHTNGDPLDNRREHLIVKQKITSLPSSSGHRWPHNSDRLLHFLEKRKGPDEDLCTEFLAKVDVKKFTQKRIDATLLPLEYESFKKKDIDLAIKRVLHKYFDWSGSLNLVKEIPPIKKDAPVPSQVTRKVVKAPEKPLPSNPYCNLSNSVEEIQQLEKQLRARSSKDILTLLGDYRIFPTEYLIKILQERGASMVQFSVGK